MLFQGVRAKRLFVGEYNSVPIGIIKLVDPLVANRKAEIYPKSPALDQV